MDELLEVPDWLFEEHEGGEAAHEVLADHDHGDLGVLLLHLRVVHWQGKHLSVVNYRRHLGAVHERPLVLNCEEVPSAGAEFLGGPENWDSVRFHIRR